MKKIFLIFLFFSWPHFEETNWATTRFEVFWKSTFKQMTFREPIDFLPYDIKIGYYEYGGLNYFNELDNFLSDNDNLESNPYNTSDPAFPNVVNKKFRKMMTLEIDFLRYNFFKDRQNILDIQFGFGYRLYKNINKVAFDNGDSLNPEFNEFNVNGTFILQFNPSYYNYLYYSSGYTRASFYDNSLTNSQASGSGISNHLGLGMNFIIPDNKGSSNLHCGIELRLSSLNIDNIDEPNNFSRIDDFKMESIGLLFSFGIGYGGRKTLGDIAYASMLNNDYIDAYEKFKLYKKGLKIYNASKVDEMLEFSQNQIPYQLYNNAMDYYYKNEFKEALQLLNKINYKDDVDLDYKINSIKYIIADKMLNDFIKIEDSQSIDYRIQYYNTVNDISPKIRNAVNKRLSILYLQKGDYLLSNNNYEEAYEFYMYSKTTGGYNPEQIKIKLSNLIIIVLNDAYNFLEKKENVIAYEKLFFAKNIADNNNDYISSLMDLLDNRIKTIKSEKIKERMKIILKDKETFVPVKIKKEILMGDSYIRVINILGEPLNQISRKKISSIYKMIKYSIDNKIYRLFFKDDILIDIDFE
tara:strand:- start:5041 stop:6783 length:1743 start_codon:yes stop_codon:yes gene_type:complete